MEQRKLSNLEQQTIALAGVTQAARLVDQISKTGSFPAEFLEASVHSLFEFEADSVADVYGGITGVKLGLQNLSSILASGDNKDASDVIRYVFGIMHLERRFSSNPAMMEVIHSRLNHAKFNLDHFSGHRQEICHSISGIYQDTLSTLKFRIKVTGSATQLEDQKNADMIRALLLSGVRSAHLWRQLGGRRWRLMFQRKRVLQLSQDLSRSLGVV